MHTYIHGDGRHLICNNLVTYRSVIFTNILFRNILQHVYNRNITEEYLKRDFATDGERSER